MDLVTALNHLRPGAQWVLIGDDYEGLSWDANNEHPKPSELELIEAYIDWEQVNGHKAKRQREYPTVEELVVALIEKEEGRPSALNELMVRRMVVKNKYPKG